MSRPPVIAQRWLSASALVVSACSGSPATSATATVEPTAAAGVATAASGGQSTSRPGPTARPSPPSGVAWLRDGKLEPGTYWFDGFRPGLQLRVDTRGWEVGHFHDDFFDLFKDGDFPSVGFGRFPEVYGAGAVGEPATDAAAVIAALKANPGLTVTDVGAIEIAGLTGRTIDVRAKAAQTLLFGSDEGVFKFDPELIARFHVLDVPGGAMEILVAARTGDLDAAIEATQPIIDSLVIRH